MSLLDYYQAVRCGNIIQVKQFIDDNKFTIDYINKLGYTPLLIACSYNQKIMVDFLLSQGANLFHQDNDGWSVLHKAGFLSHTDLYNHLLNIGANESLRTKKGNLPSIGFSEFANPEQFIPQPEIPQPEIPQPKTEQLKLPSLTSTSKNMILCPGQGSQVIGMATPFLSNQVKSLFEEANTILGYNILDIIEKGPKEKLDSTEICQVAVYLVSIASFITNSDKVISASEVAGFSLGEYTALVIGGYIDWKDGLKLISKRGKLMKEASSIISSSMISIVGLDDNLINKLCSDNNLSIANYLFPNARVLAGKTSDIKKAESVAKSLGASAANILSVSGAFHSKYMESASVELEKLIHNIIINDSKCLVWSNYTGTYHETSTLKKNLINQLTSPVQWEKIMSSTKMENLFELAPSKQLKAMMRRINLDKSNNMVLF